jgi:hypothetical protein
MSTYSEYDRDTYRADLAHGLNKVASDLSEVLAYWLENDLPADFLTGDEYPFDASLDEVVSRVQNAVISLRGAL